MKLHCTLCTQNAPLLSWYQIRSQIQSWLNIPVWRPLSLMDLPPFLLLRSLLLLAPGISISYQMCGVQIRDIIKTHEGHCRLLMRPGPLCQATLTQVEDHQPHSQRVGLCHHLRGAHGDGHGRREDGAQLYRRTCAVHLTSNLRCSVLHPPQNHRRRVE